MALTDKVKEISEEIKKTVEDSGIKDTAISAGMIITDKAKKRKEDIESKIEANRVKLDMERQHATDIQNQIYTSIIENKILLGESQFTGITSKRLVAYTQEFCNTVYKFYTDDMKRSLYFSSQIPPKIVDKVKNIYPINSDSKDEEILFCYFGGIKDNFVLTTKKLYFTIKYFDECIIYSLIIDNEKINLIYVDKDTNELKVNNVTVFKVDNSKANILNKYFAKIRSQNLYFEEDEISDEIEDIIDFCGIYDKNDQVKIKDSFDQDEKFKYLAVTTKNQNAIVCTSNRLIVKKVKNDGLQVINEIKYKDIDFIDIEDQNDITVVLNIFNTVALEIIFQGTKLKIRDINLNDAKQIVEIVNESREKIKFESKNSIDNNDIFTKIEKLAKLKESGAITVEEFESKKKELLSRI